MRKRFALLLLASSIALSACGGGNVLDDIQALSDDFDDAATLSNWKDLSTVEGNENWIETLDINETYPGEMYLAPYVSAWFEDWRGVFLHKEVTGDFDVTTRIKVNGKMTEVPEKLYSFGGLMARAPRDGGVEAWEEKKENWVFITTGYGDQSKGVGKPQLETKTTQDSVSDLRLIASRSNWLNLRIIKLGPTFYMLYQFEGEDWKLSRRFARSDMPETLQVGMLAYTDWDAVTLGPKEFNSDPTKLSGDLLIRSDYIHFERPKLPADLKDKVKEGTLKDEELVAALNGK